jgi:hypothetical protein
MGMAIVAKLKTALVPIQAIMLGGIKTLFNLFIR